MDDVRANSLHNFVGLKSFVFRCAHSEQVIYSESKRVNYRASVSTATRFNLKKSGVLIEGDSLLFYFLNMSFDNLERLVDCQYGASSLHLCYLINQFLETFVTHGVSVTVVFFNEHCNHLYDNKHYLLLRQVIIKCIEGIDGLLGIEVKQFPSFLSLEFDNYLSGRMRAIAPLELMLFLPQLSINQFYGNIMLNYWGVAVGHIARCDLVGESDIRDVVREDRDRVRADVTLQVDLEDTALRSKRYQEEDCEWIESILARQPKLEVELEGLLQVGIRVLITHLI